MTHKRFYGKKPPRITLAGNGEVITRGKAAFAEWTGVDVKAVNEVVGYWRKSDEYYGIYIIEDTARKITASAGRKNEAARRWIQRIKAPQGAL